MTFTIPDRVVDYRAGDQRVALAATVTAVETLVDEGTVELHLVEKETGKAFTVTARLHAGAVDFILPGGTGA